MSRSFLLLVFTLLTSTAIPAKSSDTLFYNDDWELCSRESGIYYGVEQLDSLGNGSSAFFYISGQLYMEETFQGGLRNGICRWWHRNGQLSVVGSYKSGIEHGKFVYWHDNGVKSSEGMYFNGESAGEWQWWDREGRRFYQASDVTNDPPLWGEQADLDRSLQLLGDIITDDLSYPVSVRLLTEESESHSGISNALTVIIYTDGTLRVVNTIHIMASELRSQITHLLEYMDGWTPAELDGEKVNTSLSLRLIIEAR